MIIFGLLLQYCFPGMWLSDLTKSRYEVREKKSVKKVTFGHSHSHIKRKINNNK